MVICLSSFYGLSLYPVLFFGGVDFGLFLFDSYI